MHADPDQLSQTGLFGGPRRWTKETAADILIDQYLREFDVDSAVDAAYEHLRFAEESLGDRIERNGIVVEATRAGVMQSYSIQHAEERG